MIQQGVGYTVTNSSDGQSLVIDQVGIYKETLPFFVYEDSNEAGQPVLRINPGTFNNVLPTVSGVTIGEPGATLPAPQATSVVAIRIPASEGAFPDGVPTIEWFTGTSPPANESGLAYLSIAIVNVLTESGSGSDTYQINNLVSGSLWGERFQCGEELEYWFSRI